MQKLIHFIVLILLLKTLGCSSSKNNSDAVKIIGIPKLLGESKPISPEELLRDLALKKYRKMRKERINKSKKIKFHYYGIKPKKIQIRRKRRRLRRDPESVIMEISQNIDYYCIVHEDDQKFLNIEECKQRGTAIWEHCKIEDGIAAADNRDFNQVSCVKKGLKEL